MVSFENKGGLLFALIVYDIIRTRDKPASIARIARGIADKHANRAVLPDEACYQPIGGATARWRSRGRIAESAKIHSATHNPVAIISAF